MLLHSCSGLEILQDKNATLIFSGRKEKVSGAAACTDHEQRKRSVCLPVCLSACLLALAAPPAPRQVRLRVRVGRPVRRPSGVQAERPCTASARTSGPAARQRPGCRIERGSCLKQGSRWAGGRARLKRRRFLPRPCGASTIAGTARIRTGSGE